MIYINLKGILNGQPFQQKKTVGEEVAKNIRILKENINNIFKKMIDLKLDNEENVNFQRSGRLEKIIIQLYNVYEKVEIDYKKLKN